MTDVNRLESEVSENLFTGSIVNTNVYIMYFKPVLDVNGDCLETCNKIDLEPLSSLRSHGCHFVTMRMKKKFLHRRTIVKIPTAEQRKGQAYTFSNYMGKR